MAVVGKMRLTSCQETRDSQYVGSDSTGKHQYEIVPSVRVEMVGVKSEPFGTATPDANFKAWIRNAGATRFFTDLWRKFVRDPDMSNQGPEFYFVMMTPTEYEVYVNDGKDLSRAERE